MTAYAAWVPLMLAGSLVGLGYMLRVVTEKRR